MDQERFAGLDIRSSRLKGFEGMKLKITK